MDQAFGSFAEKVGGCIMDGSPVASESSVADAPVKRRRSLSLSSSSGSFVPVVGEGGDWLGREIKSNQVLRGEIGLVNERLNSVINQKNQFREEASTLVGQVSESLLTLGGARVRQEKLVADQQRQMHELLSQTQKVIALCQETNTETKQQCALNSQFVGMQQRRDDVE